METLQMLGQGFAIGLSLPNLLAAAIGVIVGTLIGILPGLGVVGTISILLPVSYGMEPVGALIMFAGIFYGAMYGGSTTSILVNLPGEGGSVVTCMDGYAMAKKGRAGAALGIAAIGSFVAGTLGVIGLSFFAPVLADAALAFGPPEYFAIAVFGLAILTNLTGNSPLRNMLMVMVGIMLATIGSDPLGGIDRFTFNVDELMRGVEFTILGMGIFGLGEILLVISQKEEPGAIHKVGFRDLYPTRRELKESAAPILRGGILGFLIGLLPGPSTTLSSFASYALEKKISKKPEEFGKGAVAGVAGPESANNAASSATMIPLLSLGLPFSSASVVILSGFMVHGITPGPMLITSHPDIFWGLIASMYIGNVLLLIINFPLVGVFASLLKTPIKILMPIVAVVTLTGAFAVNNSLFDLGLLLVFGILGYFMKLTDFQLAPLAIGFFLGPTMERGLKQSLILTDGNFMGLFARPLSGSLLGIASIIILYMLVRWAVNTVKGRQNKSQNFSMED